ncbi:MAG: hypothetical protein H6726_04430 [Sandaracinaceae bacterium]|nr:hypothetical protein [Myxococcales bacterium]MCB9656876.1 hypothetical protein [Sandaracinaceae bacterium]
MNRTLYLSPSRSSLLAAAALLTVLHAAPSAAHAQRNGMARTYAGRGMTLNPHTLRIDLGPYEHGINDSGTILGPLGSGYGLRVQVDTDLPDDRDTHVQFGSGFGYGILRTLEVGVLAFPVRSGGDRFGHVTPYLRWAFVSTAAFEMGLQATLAIPTGRDENLGTAFGLPINIRIDDKVRIETGVELEIFFDTGRDDGTGDDAYLHLDIPLAFGINVGRNGFFGPRASFTIVDLDDLVVAVGGFGGATIRGRRGHGAEFTGAFSFFVDQQRPGLPDYEFVFGTNLYFGL